MYRALPRFPFSRSCEGETLLYWRERKKKPSAFTIRARYIRDIWCPLLAVVSLQFIWIRSRVYMLEGKGYERETDIRQLLALPPISDTTIPLPPFHFPRLARSSVLSKFADGQRTPPRSVHSLGLESEILIF